jgi:X-Pro dipeptidyl-peptidase
MLLSSDRDFTIRPRAGTQLTLDLARSSLVLPIVGGADVLG